MVYLEAQGDGAVFSTLAHGPHPLYVPLLMLLLDCILYLLLAIYLDQVLPGKQRCSAHGLFWPIFALLKWEFDLYEPGIVTADLQVATGARKRRMFVF